MTSGGSPTPNLSSATPPAVNYSPKISGIPFVAAASRYTAPVHIDVGGTIYTSSLETLTRFPESRLAKMFNGSIPIVLDSLKQHYFIDRDGKMFRHILNFMRNCRLVLPDDFEEIDMLREEAKFFDIPLLLKQLEHYQREKESSPMKCNNNHIISNNYTQAHPDSSHDSRTTYECVALHISPDLGERILLSGERSIIEEIYPMIASALMQYRTGVGCYQDSHYVIRFPLNGYCKVNSMQAVKRLLNAGFTIVASSGGGVEGQNFIEYLFTRKFANM